MPTDSPYPKGVFARFHLTPRAARRVELACLPLVETTLSLHVLLTPARHGVHHAWVRRVRGLDRALRAELRALAFCFDTALPDSLTCLDPAQSTIDAALKAYLAASPDAHAEAFAGSLAASRAGEERARRQAVSDPAALARRVAAFVERYWELSFEREWERLEPLLAEEARAGRAVLRRAGLPALLAGADHRLRSRSGGSAVEIEVCRAADCAESAPASEVAVPGGFAIVPSWFAWPHIWAGGTPPWPAGVIYPAARVRRDAEIPLPPEPLLGGLRACADDARLQVLRLLADRPRSTQELAGLLSLSEPALSKHLRRLTEAGVLERERDGWYVLYRLRRARLAELTRELLAFVDDEGSTARSGRGL